MNNNNCPIACNKLVVGAAGALIGGIVSWYLSQRQERLAEESRRVTPPVKGSAPTSAAPSTPEVIDLPVIDLKTFFNQSGDLAAYLNECNKLANALHEFGCVVVRDPRVNDNENETFLNMMEKYFEGSDGKKDSRPEYSYQVGVTPSFVEKARDHCTLMGAYGPGNKPLSPCPPEFDAKWRFFWRVGPRPTTTRFPSMNMEDVIPEGIPEWKETMDMWGSRMMDALFSLASMAAIGFGLPEDTFTSRMQNGPHLLAPTGSDFKVHGAKNTILAGFHSDLNFLTIHGKSRFPGLYIWTRDGTKRAVRVPSGCLLVQAGKQIEYLTGGHVLAGFHEVVVTEATVDVINRKKAAGESLWRVSSTCFGHIQSDVMLEPLPRFRNDKTSERFPPIYTGDFVMNELKAIKLGANK